MVSVHSPMAHKVLYDCGYAEDTPPRLLVLKSQSSYPCFVQRYRENCGEDPDTIYIPRLPRLEIRCQAPGSRSKRLLIRIY